MTHEQDTAKKLVAQLEYGVSSISADTASHLARARARALQTVAATEFAAQPKILHGGSLRFVASYLQGRRRWMATATLIATALLMLLALQNSLYRPPVETDTLLLASELPPEAYVDKGFHAWLEDSSQL